MHLIFKSIDGLNNEINYTSKYIKENNTYIFDDNTDKNTKINLEINDEIIFRRIGDTNMLLILNLNRITDGFYSNIRGLEFKFKCKTNELIYENDKLYINYDLFVENELINTQKIWILFK